MYSKKTTRTKDNGTAAVGGWWPCFNQGEPTRTALLVRVLVRIPYIYSFRLNLSLALSLSQDCVALLFLIFPVRFLFFLAQDVPPSSAALSQPHDSIEIISSTCLLYK
jgi:hypothetical protein